MLPVLLVLSAHGTGSDRLRVELGASGLKTYYVETLSSALGVIGQWQFDAVLLDAEQHADDFLDVVRGLRSESRAPILATTRDGDEDALLSILAAGASQILLNPLPRLVAAQLHRLIELTRPHDRDLAGRVKVGALLLDPSRALATVDGIDARLTAREFELLLLLASDAGELVHRDTISKTLGVGSTADRRRGADMHVCRIRRKLKAAGGTHLEVVTVYGQGYLLQVTPPRPLVPEPPRVEWSV